MRKLILPLTAACLLSAPIEAIATPYDNADVRPGVFVGARLQLSLGNQSGSRPRAAMMLAPARSQISDGAITRTSIGEGIALNLGSKPSLTLAGVRADRAFGLAPASKDDSGHRLGLSNGGWIAVGIGAVVVAAAVYGFSAYDEARDNTD